jgi:uncharacterized ferritin-like protein (DUF455 family)
MLNTTQNNRVMVASLQEDSSGASATDLSWPAWWSLPPVEKARRLAEVLKVEDPRAPEVWPPSWPRGCEVMSTKDLGAKPGLQSPEGQARLLHDLGNIELQAMELAVRTLAEYPDAPQDFRSELMSVAIEESQHFLLCVNRLVELGFHWGFRPVHQALWEAVGEQSLLERVMLVHRHMEATGLDAGASILNRLTGLRQPPAREIVERIVRDEVGHVQFGSRWFRRLALASGQDPDACFAELFPNMLRRVPRTEKPKLELRAQAGFNDFELRVIDEVWSATNFKIPRTN